MRGVAFAVVEIGVGADRGRGRVGAVDRDRPPAGFRRDCPAGAPVTSPSGDEAADRRCQRALARRPISAAHGCGGVEGHGVHIGRYAPGEAALRLHDLDPFGEGARARVASSIEARAKELVGAVGRMFQRLDVAAAHPDAADVHALDDEDDLEDLDRMRHGERQDAHRAPQRHALELEAGVATRSTARCASSDSPTSSSPSSSISRADMVAQDGGAIGLGGPAGGIGRALRRARGDRVRGRR